MACAACDKTREAIKKAARSAAKGEWRKAAQAAASVPAEATRGAAHTFAQEAARLRATFRRH